MIRFKATATCAVLAGGILCASCLGSFSLTNKVLDWNRELTNNKFVNALIFVGLHIVPVYELSVLADAFVINTIEFWSGDNPVAAGTVKTVKGENGNYIVTTTEKGYTITKEGEETPMELTFDKEAQSWNVTTGNKTYEIMKIKENGTVDMNLQNGTYMNVSLDAQGVMAARRTLMGNTYYAFR